jgi:NAD-dependent DNA ligase
VLVERAGDVIPYIVKFAAELRKGKEEEIIFQRIARFVVINYLNRKTKLFGVV